MFTTKQELSQNKFYQNVDSNLVLTGNTFLKNFTADTSNYESIGFEVRDLSMIIGNGFNTTTGPIVVQSDEKIVVGGAFTTYQDITTNRFARINVDGSIDQTFTDNLGAGFNSTTSAIEIDGDGKFIIGGSFSSFNNSSKNRLVRLNSDGTLDPTFNIGSGFGPSVTALLIQPDEKIVVGGSFTTFTGSTNNRLIRLNADGSKDETFNIDSGFGSGVVQSISRQTDGKLIIAGSFTTFTGSTNNRIIRLNSNGTKDETFVVGTGFNNSVSVCKIQSDGKLLAGGSFTSYSGVTSNRIIRLHPNGSVDATFNVGTGFNIGNVISMQIQSDGKIIVAGSFTTYNGTISGGIIRLNSDGSIDTTFKVGNGLTGGNPGLHGLYLQTSGKVLLGGGFTSYKNKPINRFIRLNADGSADAGDSNITVKNGIINYDGFYSLSKLGNNSLTPRSYVDNYIKQGTGISKVSDTIHLGGTINREVNLTGDDSFQLFSPEINFFNKGSDPAGLFIKSDFFSDTSVWDINTVNSFLIANDNGIMQFDNVTKNFNKYAVRTNGNVERIYYAPSISKYYFVGNFSEINTSNAASTTFQFNCFGRLGFGGDSFETTFRIGSGFNGTPACIIGYTGDTMFIGGQFTKYSGVTTNQIVLLRESDATIVSSFNAGAFSLNGVVYVIKPQLDGKVLIGGNFTEYSGVSVNNIVRLNSDGSIDETFVSGNGLNGVVYSIDIQNDGKILVGGDFTEYDFNSSPGIVRLDVDGTYDPTFISNGFDFPFVSEIKFLDFDDTILVGGPFTQYSGQTQSGLMKLNLDGSINLAFSGNSGTGLYDGAQFGSVFVRRIIENGSTITVGGQFTEYNTNPVGHILNINNDGTFIPTNSGDKMLVTGKLTYTSDLSSTFKARSIPDVGFVTGITSTLIGEVNNGLTRVGNNLRFGGSLTGLTSLDVSGNTLVISGDTAGSSIILQNWADGDYTTSINLSDYSLSLSSVVEGTMASQLDINDLGFNILGRSPVSGKRYRLWGNDGRIHMDGVSTANVVRTSFRISAEQALFVDSRTGTTAAGIQYSADYSANFTSRSLVDKGYVDSLVTGGAVTANNGLTKVGNNVRLGGTLTGNTLIALGTGNADLTISGSSNNAITFARFDGGLYFNDTTGGGIFFNDTGAGGVYFDDPNGGSWSVNSNGGGISLNDSGGGGVYLNDSDGGIGISSNGGGVFLTDSNTGGIYLTSEGIGQFSRIKFDARDNVVGGGTEVIVNAPTTGFTGGFEINAQTASANNNKIVDALTIKRSVLATGVSAAGIGARIVFTSHNNLGNPTAQYSERAGITYQLTDVTATSEDGKYTFSVNKTGGTANIIDIDANGLKYYADYSANYTNRSLVDKAYVDSSIVAGGYVGNIVTGTSFTAVTSSQFVGVSATTTTTVYLPASPTLFKPYTVTDIRGNGETVNITINGNTKLIQGSSTALIDTNYGSMTFIYNGFNWSVISVV